MSTSTEDVIGELKRHLPPVSHGAPGILRRLVEFYERAKETGASVSDEIGAIRFEARMDPEDVEADGLASAYWSDDLARFEVSIFKVGLIFEAVAIADPADATHSALARSDFASELEDFRDRHCL